MDEYPSNSKRTSMGRVKSPQEEKHIKKITTGTIVKREKPILIRIFGEHTESIGNYILWDVLVPAAKNTITEMISNGIEMLMYGETRSNLKRDRGRSYVSYGGYYKDRERERERRTISPRETRNRHRFEDIVIESRFKAEEVLSALVDLIDDYEIATVADFYDLVGLNAEWADNKHGWDNLSRASVRRVRFGYILDLPKPIAID